MRGHICALLWAVAAQAALVHGSAHAKWTIGQIEDPPESAVPCSPLSKELLSKFAVSNLVLVTVVDRIIMQKFGKSWVKNTEAAGIKYGFVAALDPWTSKVLGSWGVQQCFNAPMDKLKYRGADNKYQWGSAHWSETTWNKVRVIAAVYELGFHVIHSDADVTWFQDPMPYFSKYLNGPVHALFTTDALESKNKPEDQGLEQMTTPYININTGVYFVRQYAGGANFFEQWFKLKSLGHDQDGLNTLVRGRWHRNDNQYPTAGFMGDRLIRCALDNNTLVSLLPVSMFGNAYTYVTGQVHKQLKHPLYEVHWVWSGSTMESKQQTIRDAMKFWDPPEYYTTPNLLTFDIWVPEPYADFNKSPFDDTEKMIQFHIHAANTQLRQAYFGFIAAMALERVLVMPKFQCFCAKNWYMTQSCRINGEPHSTFPFDCALSHMMRVKKLLHGGMTVAAGAQHGAVTIREHTFMQNPNVPEEVKRSRLVLVPAAVRRPSADVVPPSASALKEEPQADGSVHVRVPWPLDDEDLKGLMAPFQKRFRVIHIANVSLILSRGFHSNEFHKKFDGTISKLTTHWCCRSPDDQKKYNATDKVELRILPADRDPGGSAFRAVFGIERSSYNNTY